MQNQGDSQKNEQTFTTIPAAEDPKRLRPLRKVGIAIIIILVLAAIVTTIGIATGYIKVSFGKSTTIVEASSSAVCNTAVITDYNALVSVSSINEQERATATQNVKDFAAEVEKKDGFESDATCLFIAYASALSANDIPKATGYVNKIDDYAKKGVFVDTRLNGVTSIKQMRGTVQVVTPSQNGLQGRG